ncbi:MAG: alpha/beta hydrolase [Fischerella sp.]|uniref:alpha/beta fold hydrolase n=1 Tax=Fischerella sp. TaxID=1191 RepID=UPI00185E759D|nr:alpha/beta hydrolase [Fischerella sp.]NWF62246.1 alpha/beta hydrolase [Fischerella sp.]
MLWLILAVIVLGTLIAVAIAYDWYTNQAIRRAEAEFPPQGNFVKVAGVKLHYICKGSGQAVILLHDNPGFLQDYLPETFNCIAQEYCAYAFDRPGHGYSTRPNQQATPLVQAQLLRGALQKLGIEKPILVGHCWSSAIVLAYALRYPDEISGIVLISAIAYKVTRALLPLAKFAQFPLLGMLLKFLPPILIGRIFRKRLREAFSPTPLPREYAKAAQALWARPIQIQAMLQDNSSLQSTLNIMKKHYGEINIPVVIVIGDADNFISPKVNAYRLHSHIPHSQLCVLPKTGHAIPQTQPEAILKAINIIGK